MNTKNLTLDVSRIEDVLNSLDGCVCTKGTSNAKLVNYSIFRRADGANPTISVYHKEGGRTTLVAGPKDKIFGEEITAKIVEITQTTTLSNINDVIIVDSADFTQLLEELGSADKLTIKEISGGTEYTFNGEHKEKFVFKYYTKRSKLQLIGPPLTFLMQILASLDGMGYSATKKIIEKATEIAIDTPNLWDEYMPHTKGKMPQILQDIVEPSMIYVKVSIPLPDYASHLHPVLRGMESSMRQVLGDNGVVVDKDRFQVFTKSNHVYILDIDYRHGITEAIRIKVERCYNFYNKHRHSLFHASDEPMEVTRIEHREDALELLFESFDIMEELHAPI